MKPPIPTSAKDFPNVCRLCIEQFTEPRRISLYTYKTPKRASQFVLHYLHLPVSPDDGLPRHICRKCFKRLKNWGIFHRRCQRNMQMLQEVLKTEKRQRPIEFVDTGPTVPKVEFDYLQNDSFFGTHSKVSKTSEGPSPFTASSTKRPTSPIKALAVRAHVENANPKTTPSPAGPLDNPAPKSSAQSSAAQPTRLVHDVRAPGLKQTVVHLRTADNTILLLRQIAKPPTAPERPVDRPLVDMNGSSVNDDVAEHQSSPIVEENDDDDDYDDADFEWPLAPIDASRFKRNRAKSKKVADTNLDDTGEATHTLCYLCGGYFENNKIGAHMLSKHPEMRNLKCLDCGQTFEKPQGLQTHQYAKHIMPRLLEGKQLPFGDGPIVVETPEDLPISTDDCRWTLATRFPSRRLAVESLRAQGWRTRDFQPNDPRMLFVCERTRTNSGSIDACRALAELRFDTTGDATSTSVEFYRSDTPHTCRIGLQLRTTIESISEDQRPEQIVDYLRRVKGERPLPTVSMVERVVHEFRARQSAETAAAAAAMEVDMTDALNPDEYVWRMDEDGNIFEQEHNVCVKEDYDFVACRQ